MTADAGLTSSDVLAGQIAALLPALPQGAYEAAAEGLIALGWRLAPDRSVTEEILTEHSFVVEDEGDGWNEPATWWYSCSCTKAEYAQWTQTDPDMTGLAEFQQEGREDAMALHHAHVAQILTGTAPEDVPKPEYHPVLTEDAIVAGANQMRSQTGDFTSTDILMRKRAKFVLRAAIPYLGVEPAR
jgi:hypothetical protein